MFSVHGLSRDSYFWWPYSYTKKTVLRIFRREWLITTQMFVSFVFLSETNMVNKGNQLPLAVLWLPCMSVWHPRTPTGTYSRIQKREDVIQILKIIKMFVLVLSWDSASWTSVRIDSNSLCAWGAPNFQPSCLNLQSAGISGLVYVMLEMESRASRILDERSTN